jgi:hypothetical protein
VTPSKKLQVCNGYQRTGDQPTARTIEKQNRLVLPTIVAIDRIAQIKLANACRKYDTDLLAKSLATNADDCTTVPGGTRRFRKNREGDDDFSFMQMIFCLCKW